MFIGRKRRSGQAPVFGINRGPENGSLRFPVKILNDPCVNNEAGCILLFTCGGESTLKNNWCQFSFQRKLN